MVEHVPVGGLNLWVGLPDGNDVDHLVRECETTGLLVAPGSERFPAEPSGPFIRLNFSSENLSRFAEAGELLDNALGTLTSSTCGGRRRARAPLMPRRATIWAASW